MRSILLCIFITLWNYVLSVKCTKTNIYYGMKNCNEDATTLRNYITNIVDHYKVAYYNNRVYFGVENGWFHKYITCCLYSILNFCREIITTAIKTLAVKKMAMFAARNLLSVKELLLPTGKPSRAQQSTKMQRIMPW